MRHHHTDTRKAKIKKADRTTSWQEYVGIRNEKWCKHFLENNLLNVEKFHIALTYDVAILFLSMGFP
jgi:predicted urease superfamily metal-dependent hydrolase